jgi:hypothetical protein
MAGVFGGLHSGINEHTTSVFLESAIFQAQAVRRTATRHQLRTDAAKIFEKGGDVNKTIVALQRAAYLITQIAGGTPSVINDCYPNPVLPAIIHTTFSYINQSIGDNLAPQKNTPYPTKCRIRHIAHRRRQPKTTSPYRQNRCAATCRCRRRSTTHIRPQRGTNTHPKFTQLYPTHPPPTPTNYEIQLPTS